MQFTKKHVIQWLTNHRDRVSMKMSALGNDLAIRGRRHDNSYADNTETDLFIKYLSETNPEKKQRAKALLDGVHQSRNDYCPQFFDKGIDEMNIIQLIEYICEKMASLEEARVSVDEVMPDISVEDYKKAVLSGIDVSSVELMTLIENTIGYIANRNQYIKAMIERAEKNYGEVEKE